MKHLFCALVVSLKTWARIKKVKIKTMHVEEIMEVKIDRGKGQSYQRQYFHTRYRYMYLLYYCCVTDI